MWYQIEKKKKSSCPGSIVPLGKPQEKDIFLRAWQLKKKTFFWSSKKKSGFFFVATKLEGGEEG